MTLEATRPAQGCSLQDRVPLACPGLTGETRRPAAAPQKASPSATGRGGADACLPPPADLVAGPRADLRLRQALCLHPRPLRVQSLLLPLLRHARRQVHLLGRRQGQRPPPGTTARKAPPLLAAGEALPCRGARASLGPHPGTGLGPREGGAQRSSQSRARPESSRLGLAWEAPDGGTGSLSWKRGSLTASMGAPIKDRE